MGVKKKPGWKKKPGFCEDVGIFATNGKRNPVSGHHARDRPSKKETGFLRKCMHPRREISKKPGFWPPRDRPPKEDKKPGFCRDFRLRAEIVKRNPVSQALTRSPPRTRSDKKQGFYRQCMLPADKC